MTKQASLRLRAIGDISFEGPKANSPSFDCFREVADHLAEADLVIGNLEGPLTDKGEPVQGKCTLRGSPGWANVLRSAGVNVVTLANNHMMDYGETGLLATFAALDQAGIRYVGAGKNRQEACAPLLLEIGGERIALLARSSVLVGARTYADERHAGVAFLDVKELIESIRASKTVADRVIVLLHWGLEQYRYPSPYQRRLARQCVEAGADAILGHHPHVLQGIERYRSVPIIYSLGNFIFNEFEWTYTLPGATSVKFLSTLTPENRDGVIATLEWTTEKSPRLMMAPTHIDRDGRVRLHRDPYSSEKLYKHCRNLAVRPYPLIWTMYAARTEWQLRLGSRLSLWKILRNLYRLRPHHIEELVRSMKRSARIVLQKTTNPYE